MTYTPNQLFDIASTNPIIRQFIDYWRGGHIEWETMLFQIARQLEARCNDLADENNIRDLIGKNNPPFLPNYVLETSLIPDVSGTNSPLERQSKLIESIILINEFHEIFMSFILAKKDREFPTIVVFKNSSMQLEGIAIGDRLNNANRCQ